MNQQEASPNQQNLFIDPNPYDVLEISPDATTKDIPKAFAMAMKKRKYPAETIAKARKRLMNPKERLIAHYLRPILPEIAEFKNEDLENLDVSDQTVDWLYEIDDLEEAIANRNQPREIDRRVGSNLSTDFFALLDREVDLEVDL